MKRKAVVIDLDNTLVDTAVRKARLLSSLPAELVGTVSLDEIRADFHLISILGAREAIVSKQFFTRLEQPATIAVHIAPLFPYAKETLDHLAGQGLAIIVVTARPNQLRDVTLSELKSLGLDQLISDLVMMEPHRIDSEGDKEIIDFKAKCLHDLLINFDVVAFIGDRPEDLSAAQMHEIPFILMRTTLTSAEVLKLEQKGIWLCNSWEEADSLLESIRAGQEKMNDLRIAFANQYARWLTDLDNKCFIICTIAAAITALTGKLILDLMAGQRLGFERWETIPIAIALTLAIFSMLYAICSFTSRHTSGLEASSTIRVGPKQWFAYLFGHPSSWLSVNHDPISQYNELVEDPSKQSRAHQQFFYSKYKTYDPDVLLNMRLYELRAANYSKIYPERWASTLLSWAIFALLVWIIIKASLFLLDP